MNNNRLVGDTARMAIDKRIHWFLVSLLEMR